MQLGKLLSGLETSVYADISVGKVTCDSRRIAPGDVFVAVGGANHGADHYIADAISRGAVATVTDLPLGAPGAIRVGDADHAASVIFSNYYGDPTKDMTLVAVTGTNGKTSTVGALSAILEASGRRVGTLGTTGMKIAGEEISRADFFSPGAATMTTPGVEDLYKALGAMRDAGCDFAVVEASSHSLFAKRFDAAQISLGIFTNLSRDHLDFHGDMESYYRTKSTLADISNEFIANCDDPWGNRLFREKGCLGITARGCAGCFVGAENFKSGREGSEYDAVTRDGRVHITTPQIGGFALYNTLSAFAASRVLGIGTECAARALSGYRGERGRMERVDLGRGRPDVFIDYAHTPAALEAALKCARGICKGKLSLVFGCGGDRDKTKRAPMGEIAHRLADRVYLTSDNPRTEDPEKIISDVQNNNKYDNYTVITERAEAIGRAISDASPEDLLLLAGKGHEDYVTDNSGTRRFDEREILREICGIRSV